jgi:Domain of unknown function (DUF4405)
MNTQTKPMNRTKLNLVVDIVIFLAFLLVTQPHLTGIAVHEWLGISFGAGIATHVLLHWQWVVETTKRIFSKLPKMQRINYALNTLLLIDVALIIVSGLAISKVALPVLGITLVKNHAWMGVHIASATASFVLVGLHVALHWNWVVSTLSRYIANPQLTLKKAKA